MSWITTKLLGFVSGGLLLALVLCGAFAGLQTRKLATANDKVAALEEGVKDAKAATDLAVTTANDRAAALVARDGIIAQQSTSIDALAIAAQQDRSVYTAGLARANTAAKSNEARAVEIIALPAPAPDMRCEAARTLIEQELLNVR